MKKYAIVILTVRDDLMEGMIKSFFYKNKVSDLDLYIAVEDRMGFDEKRIKGLCMKSNNPNWKSAKVIKMTDWTEDYIKSVGGKLNKKFGVDFLRINQKSGFTLPQLDLLNKGYESVLLCEEDQLIVGPVMELLRSNHTMFQSNFGSAHKHKGNKESNFWRMDEMNGIDSEDDVDELVGISRNPYIFAKNAKSYMSEIFLNYMNDEGCFKRWIMYSQSGRKTEKRGDGVPKRIDSVEKIYDKWKEVYSEEVEKAYALPGDLWEDSSKLNQILNWKLVNDKSVTKVFPTYPRLGPSISLSNGMPTKSLTEKVLTSGFIIHYTYAGKKPEAQKLLLKYMDELGYNGEFTADKFVTKRHYNWQKDPKWLLKILSKGIGSEWKEMYRTGTWLNPDYLKMSGKNAEEELED